MAVDQTCVLNGSSCTIQDVLFLGTCVCVCVHVCVHACVVCVCVFLPPYHLYVVCVYNNQCMNINVSKLYVFK